MKQADKCRRLSSILKNDLMMNVTVKRRNYWALPAGIVRRKPRNHSHAYYKENLSEKES